MSKAIYLGEFEHFVLLTVLRLGDEAYGMSIREDLERRAGRSTSIGAVYATLDRLEAKGCLKSRTGEATPERGGRAKRYFTITAAGERALAETQRTMARMTEGLRFAEAR